jgi:hypothetical protein
MPYLNIHRLLVIRKGPKMSILPFFMIVLREVVNYQHDLGIVGGE